MPRRTPARYVALLRGINVGGKNLIAMADLRACFEAQGFDDVTTYIQSGNVLFGAAEGDPGALARTIERALSKAFGYEARVVLRSRRQLGEVVARAPEGFGASPATHRCDVLFLKAPLTPARALAELPAKEGVDALAAGPGVVYASRPIARAAQSRLTRLVGLPLYQDLTIRNWNTTTKLAALLAARPPERAPRAPAAPDRRARRLEGRERAAPRPEEAR